MKVPGGKLKKGVILFLLLVLSMTFASCLPREFNQTQGSVRQVMGNPPFYEVFSTASEMYESQPIMLIGTPIDSFEQREPYEYCFPAADGVAATPHHFTRAEIRVLEVVKNESEREILPGDVIVVTELCGYGEYEGETFFVYYNEYQYPLLEYQPYAFFLNGGYPDDPSGAYTQGWMGSFDITSVEPTQEERDSIQENVALAHDHPHGTSFLSSYTKFKKSIFEIPDLKEVLDKYVE